MVWSVNCCVNNGVARCLGKGFTVPRWPSARWRTSARLAHAGALVGHSSDRARAAHRGYPVSAATCIVLKTYFIPLELVDSVEILRSALQLLCHRQAQHTKPSNTTSAHRGWTTTNEHPASGYLRYTQRACGH